MTPGYFAFYRGRSIVSRLIQWRTWSPYSHVAFWEPLPTPGKYLAMEAWWPDGVIVRLSDLGHKPGTVVDLYECPSMTIAHQRAIVAFIASQLDKPYDLRGIYGFLPRCKTQNPGAWFCSELILSAAFYAGLDLLSRRLLPGQCDPGILSWSPLLIYHSSVTLGASQSAQGSQPIATPPDPILQCLAMRLQTHPQETPAC